MATVLISKWTVTLHPQIYKKKIVMIQSELNNRGGILIRKKSNINCDKKLFIFESSSTEYVHLLTKEYLL